MGTARLLLRAPASSDASAACRSLRLLLSPAESHGVVGARVASRAIAVRCRRKEKREALPGARTETGGRGKLALYRHRSSSFLLPSPALRAMVCGGPVFRDQRPCRVDRAGAVRAAALGSSDARSRARRAAPRRQTAAFSSSSRLAARAHISSRRRLVD